MFVQSLVWRRVTTYISSSNRLCDSSPMKRKLSGSVVSPLLKKQKMSVAKITLTHRERQLRKLLLDVACYIDESKELKEKIELRWAGGWVRDKLLNIESHDIDTAINVMTGHSFALKLKKYLEDEQNLKRHSMVAEEVGSLHKILANPEKSKHLETATTKVLSFDIDFVNLRKETYSDDSRNPQMEFGTAVEDAERRDATINALFYNLHTDEVEDFVGGLDDLKARRIRTPLQPEQTFKDDPLRVLRLIRFASRLEFNIDPQSEEWMSNSSVMDALKLKISRERVGVELEKMLKGMFTAFHEITRRLMLKGNNPQSSLRYVDKLGLYPAIFMDPTARDILTPDTTRWSQAYNCLQTLESNNTPGSIYQILVRSDDARYISWILAALAPWSTIPNPEKSGSKMLPLFGTRVAQEGIKASSKICAHINGAFKNYNQITNLKNAVAQGQAFINERDTVGMKIRKWDADGGNWRIQALFALLVEAMNHPTSSDAAIDALFSGWQALIDHLDNLDIMDAPAEKPLINGSTLMRQLNAKSGPWIKVALDICMAWQLRNPGASGPESESAAIDEVRKRSKELEIPVNK